jgi:hypothetical protein
VEVKLATDFHYETYSDKELEAVKWARDAVD